MRDTIFISHATPEDNDFSVWLGSRLELLGYKVWVDKKKLLGGETFWETIEEVITQKAIKVLLVYSSNLSLKNQKNNIKPGIQREIDLTKEVITKNSELTDFLIPLHIDNSSYDLFKDSEKLNHIPFNNNWAEGLGKLVEKLQKDSAPTFDNSLGNNFSEWYLENYLIDNPIIEKKELYYTNWWTIKQLPKQFHIYRFATDLQAKAIHEANKEKIIVLDSNCITTFNENLNFDILHDNEVIKIKVKDFFTIEILELLNGIDSDTFPTNRDAENHFKKLLKRCLHIHFKVNKLSWYELSNKNLAYYHNPNSLPSSKVKFTFPFREINEKPNKTKNLYGRYLTLGKWHYALSFKPILKPYLGFAIKSHIIFSKDGWKPWDEKEQQHAHRRKKGKRLFNDEWRDLLLGFISSLKVDSNSIILESNTDDKIVMKDNVNMFWSDYGYNDPTDTKRQELFTIEDKENIDE